MLPSMSIPRSIRRTRVLRACCCHWPSSQICPRSRCTVIWQNFIWNGIPRVIRIFTDISQSSSIIGLTVITSVMSSTMRFRATVLMNIDTLSWALEARRMIYCLCRGIILFRSCPRRWNGIRPFFGRNYYVSGSARTSGPVTVFHQSCSLRSSRNRRWILPICRRKRERPINVS
jgi:hypothetical protein